MNASFAFLGHRGFATRRFERLMEPFVFRNRLEPDHDRLDTTLHFQCEIDFVDRRVTELFKGTDQPREGRVRRRPRPAVARDTESPRLDQARRSAPAQAAWWARDTRRTRASRR